MPAHEVLHLGKPWVLSPLRSLCLRNEVVLVPLACEDGGCGTYCTIRVKSLQKHGSSYIDGLVEKVWPEASSMPLLCICEQ